MMQGMMDHQLRRLVLNMTHILAKKTFIAINIICILCIAASIMQDQVAHYIIGYVINVIIVVSVICVCSVVT